DAKLRIWIENHQVSVTANRDRSFPALDSRESRGSVAHPFRHMRQSIAASKCHRPDRSQPELQGRYSTPSAHEVSFLAEFHCGKRRRMIRNDRVDDPIAKRGPESFAILAITYRRRAFEFCCAVGDLFGGKGEVMRTGLDAHAKSVGSRFPQRLS